MACEHVRKHRHYGTDWDVRRARDAEIACLCGECGVNAVMEDNCNIRSCFTVSEIHSYVRIPAAATAFLSCDIEAPSR